MKEELARQEEVPIKKARKPKSSAVIALVEMPAVYDGLIEEPTIDIRKTAKMDQQQLHLPKAMKQLAVKLNKFDQELSELPETIKNQLAAASDSDQQNSENGSTGSAVADVPDVMKRSIDYEELFLNSNLADHE